jgi:zinc transporter ZupT
MNATTLRRAVATGLAGVIAAVIAAATLTFAAPPALAQAQAGTTSAVEVKDWDV